MLPGVQTRRRLHYLVLGQTSSLGFHGVSSTGSLVLYKAQAKRAATVLIAREFGNGSLSIVGSVETDHTGTAGSSIGLVLDLGLFDLADGSEEFNEILIASRPRKLHVVSWYDPGMRRVDLHFGRK